MNTTTKLMTLMLALILPASAFALCPYSYTNYEFAVDGIYYKIVDNEACVTFQEYRSGMHLSDYHGDVVIPATVTYQDVTYPVTTIDYYAFNYCQGLTSITIPESITTIKDDAFYLCTRLACVNLLTPTVVIEKHAFSMCSALTTITCPLTTPPAMYYEECFDRPHYENATLYVPASAVESYRNAPVWNRFVHIQAIDTQPGDEDGYEYVPIVREGVTWVNEKVIVNHGDTTRYYYNYEICGNDTTWPNMINKVFKACYYYTGDKLDVNTDSLIAGLDGTKNYTTCGRNDAYRENIYQNKCLIYFDQYVGAGEDIFLYYFLEGEGLEPEWDNTIEYYLACQQQSPPTPEDQTLTHENFTQVDPVEIEGVTCRRWCYKDENGEPLAYIIEGIGFDSRDMGDLLTPFTRRPDPNADYQEWCGLSHVVKDGKIIYKGMCYHPIEIPGDVNGDGEITVADANSVIDVVIMGGNASHPRIPIDSDGNYIGDVNGDGEVTIADVNAIIDMILNNH